MKKKTTHQKFIPLLLLVFMLTLSACQALALPGEPTSVNETKPTQIEETKLDPNLSTPEKSEVVPPELTPESAPEPRKPKLWVEPDLPVELASKLPSTEAFELTEHDLEADYILGFGAEEGVTQWVYALAAPFKTINDDVSFEVLKSFWQTGKNFPAKVLVVDESTHKAMSYVLGKPGTAVKVMHEDEIMPYFEKNSQAWAILPFESLQPQLKVIALDGQSPIYKGFNPQKYQLSVSISIHASEKPVLDSASFAFFGLTVEGYRKELQAVLPESNRLADKLTTVMMTGVTALVRATAMEMRSKGILYPGEDVREVMREADIAHVSNEVPFYSQCPPPQWTQENLIFCSDPEYIDLLLDIGTDVVDLTGDHFSDFGPDAVLETLDIYDAHNIPYFGGGRNIKEAVKPVKFDINGNKIAFLGCNGKAIGYARASETEPGAYSCRMDDMVQSVEALVKEGYLPIFTFQHIEYYHWGAEPYLVEDFRRIAEAGAVVITGSQGHHPHAYEFHEGSFVHYGLGNLFFDQIGTYEDTDKTFLDRIVFYDGRMLNIELLTAQFVDWAKPKWTTPEQREYMLQKLFEVSDWE